ncbi:PD40 domain-containing protein [candidate division WWE3 bacterium]|uniref:PD40 domain-containing protein n=1 Tax=candidate division WWE3 bacterium TaxID=2053526 RepID=A0A955LJ64_UNCKA|nr:PD40 domain-containing protein [candidate division WWE3 bacterium]
MKNTNPTAKTSPSVVLKLTVLTLSTVFLFFFIHGQKIASQSAGSLIERVSVNSAGEEANGPSSRNDINADGRYVVFASLATNLVDGDTNDAKDIFLRDRVDDTTIRVSVNDSGTQGNGESDSPVISADGRYVAFESYATNLVSGDTNGKSDIFVYDTVDQTTTRVSVATAGTQADGHSFYPAISGDGQYVVFESAATNLVTSDTNNVRDIFLRDTVGSTTTRESYDSAGDSEGNGDSLHPVISQDGRYIAFTSVATNLLSGDTNDVADVFLRDTVVLTNIRVSVSSTGTEANGGSAFPAIDDDGSYIAYESVADNLVSDDTNDVRDVFVYSRLIGETSRVSTDTAGDEGNNSSGDGVDAQSIDISGDGEYILFKSRATNLVDNDTNGVVDVFMNHQRESFVTSRVSLTNTGGEANYWSYYPSVSSDGQYVSFYSYATNLIDNDTNGFGDIFVFDRDMTAITPTPTPTGSPTPTPTPEVTATPTPNPVTVDIPQNTSTPTEVEVETAAGTATIRCEQVTTAGSLSIYVLQTPPGQIDDTLTILKTNFDITTDDLVCSIITICLPYNESEVDPAGLSEDELRMYHYTSGAWSDVTTYIDTDSNLICGRPSTLSPFVVGKQSVEGAAATPTPTVSSSQSTIAPTQPQLPSSGFAVPTLIVSTVVILILGLGVALVL